MLLEDRLALGEAVEHLLRSISRMTLRPQFFNQPSLTCDDGAAARHVLAGQSDMSSSVAGIAGHPVSSGAISTTRPWSVITIREPSPPHIRDPNACHRDLAHADANGCGVAVTSPAAASEAIRAAAMPCTASVASVTPSGASARSARMMRSGFRRAGIRRK